MASRRAVESSPNPAASTSAYVGRDPGVGGPLDLLLAADWLQQRWLWRVRPERRLNRRKRHFRGGQRLFRIRGRIPEHWHGCVQPNRRIRRLARNQRIKQHHEQRRWSGGGRRLARRQLRRQRKPHQQRWDLHPRRSGFGPEQPERPALRRRLRACGRQRHRHLHPE